MGWKNGMVDMELDDEDKIDAPTPKKPDYPYGLRICLTHKELEKLGLEADCAIGDSVDLRALAEVTSVSKNDYGDGPECRVELQIKKLAVENEDDE